MLISQRRWGLQQTGSWAWVSPARMKRGGGWPGGLVAVAAVLQLGLASSLILPPTPVFLPPSEVGRPPRCREGYNYFRDFIKCDASIGSYCFQYGKSSCVGQWWRRVRFMQNVPDDLFTYSLFYSFLLFTIHSFFEETYFAGIDLFRRNFITKS